MNKHNKLNQELMKYILFLYKGSERLEATKIA